MTEAQRKLREAFKTFLIGEGGGHIVVCDKCGEELISRQVKIELIDCTGGAEGDSWFLCEKCVNEFIEQNDNFFSNGKSICASCGSPVNRSDAVICDACEEKERKNETG